MTTASTPSVTIYANKISSTAAEAIHVEDGTIDIFANRISSTAGSGVVFLGGTLSITAFEISSSAGRAIEYNNASGAALTIANARLVSSYNSANGQAVYIASSGNALKLMRCVLIASNASAKSIDAAFSQTVNLYGACETNNGKGTNVTIPVAPASQLETNANIT